MLPSRTTFLPVGAASSRDRPVRTRRAISTHHPSARDLEAGNEKPLRTGPRAGSPRSRETWPLTPAWRIESPTQKRRNHLPRHRRI